MGPPAPFEHFISAVDLDVFGPGKGQTIVVSNLWWYLAVLLSNLGAELDQLGLLGDLWNLALFLQWTWPPKVS